MNYPTKEDIINTLSTVSPDITSKSCINGIEAILASSRYRHFATVDEFAAFILDRIVDNHIMSDVNHRIADKIYELIIHINNQ